MQQSAATPTGKNASSETAEMLRSAAGVQQGASGVLERVAGVGGGVDDLRQGLHHAAARRIQELAHARHRQPVVLRDERMRKLMQQRCARQRSGGTKSCHGYNSLCPRRSLVVNASSPILLGYRSRANGSSADLLFGVRVHEAALLADALDDVVEGLQPQTLRLLRHPAAGVRSEG